MDIRISISREPPESEEGDVVEHIAAVTGAGRADGHAGARRAATAPRPAERLRFTFCHALGAPGVGGGGSSAPRSTRTSNTASSPAAASP